MIGRVGGGYERKETISKLVLASLYYSVVLQDCYLSEDYSQLNLEMHCRKLSTLTFNSYLFQLN